MATKAEDAENIEELEDRGPGESWARRVSEIWCEAVRRHENPRGGPYAPGFWTGYGVKTLPGVREGIEEREWEEVRLFVGEIAAALDRVSDGLEEAVGILD